MASRRKYHDDDDYIDVSSESERHSDCQFIVSDSDSSICSYPLVSRQRSVEFVSSSGSSDTASDYEESVKKLRKRPRRFGTRKSKRIPAQKDDLSQREDQNNGSHDESPEPHGSRPRRSHTRQKSKTPLKVSSQTVEIDLEEESTTTGKVSTQTIEIDLEEKSNTFGKASSETIEIDIDDEPIPSNLFSFNDDYDTGGQRSQTPQTTESSENISLRTVHTNVSIPQDTSDLILQSLFTAAPHLTDDGHVVLLQRNIDLSVFPIKVVPEHVLTAAETHTLNLNNVIDHTSETRNNRVDDYSVPSTNTSSGILGEVIRESSTVFTPYKNIVSGVAGSHNRPTSHEKRKSKSSTITSEVNSETDTSSEIDKNEEPTVVGFVPKSKSKNSKKRQLTVAVSEINASEKSHKSHTSPYVVVTNKSVISDKTAVTNELFKVPLQLETNKTLEKCPKESGTHTSSFLPDDNMSTHKHNAKRRKQQNTLSSKNNTIIETIDRGSSISHSETVIDNKIAVDQSEKSVKKAKLDLQHESLSSSKSQIPISIPRTKSSKRKRASTDKSSEQSSSESETDISKISGLKSLQPQAKINPKIKVKKNKITSDKQSSKTESGSAKNLLPIKGSPVMQHIIEAKAPIDTVIICSDGKIGCHRIVVAAASPFVGQLFNDHRLGEIGVLMLPDISEKVVRIILDLCYTGQMVFPQNLQTEVMEAMHCLLIGETGQFSLSRAVFKDSSSKTSRRSDKPAERNQLLKLENLRPPSPSDYSSDSSTDLKVPQNAIPITSTSKASLPKVAGAKSKPVSKSSKTASPRKKRGPKPKNKLTNVSKSIANLSKADNIVKVSSSSSSAHLNIKSETEFPKTEKQYTQTLLTATPLHRPVSESSKNVSTRGRKPKSQLDTTTTSVSKSKAKSVTHASSSSSSALSYPSDKTSVHPSGTDLMPVTKSLYAGIQYNEKQSYQCGLCLKTVPYPKSNLIRHLSEVHGNSFRSVVIPPKDIKQLSHCTMCNKQYKSINDGHQCLREHGLSRCYNCYGIFPVDSLTEHYNSAHGLETKFGFGVKCQWCDLVIVWKNVHDYVKHMMNGHASTKCSSNVEEDTLENLRLNAPAEPRRLDKVTGLPLQLARRTGHRVGKGQNTKKRNLVLPSMTFNPGVITLKTYRPTGTLRQLKIQKLPKVHVHVELMDEMEVNSYLSRNQSVSHDESLDACVLDEIKTDETKNYQDSKCNRVLGMTSESNTCPKGGNDEDVQSYKEWAQPLPNTSVSSMDIDNDGVMSGNQDFSLHSDSETINVQGEILNRSSSINWDTSLLHSNADFVMHGGEAGFVPPLCDLEDFVYDIVPATITAPMITPFIPDADTVIDNQ